MADIRGSHDHHSATEHGPAGTPGDLGSRIPGADLGGEGTPAHHGVPRSQRVSQHQKSHADHARTDAAPAHGASQIPVHAHGAAAASHRQGVQGVPGTAGAEEAPDVPVTQGTTHNDGAPAPSKSQTLPVINAAAGSHQVGYRPPDSNPYIDGENPIGHVTKGYQPVRPGTPKRKLSKKTRNRAIIAIVVVFAVLLGLFGLAWSNRSVQFKLNGETENIKVGTSLEDLVAEKGLSPVPGNLVSVSGKVLEEGKGNPFSAKLGDKDLSMDEARGTHINGGEDITIGDGTDVMEEYDSKTIEEQPKLTMDGTWGALSYISQWGKVGKKEVRTGKQSGETADGDVIQEVQNCVISVRNPAPADGKKLVALTFDDGPSIYTERYLDILKQYNAKATFFELGDNIKELPDITKKVVESGNQLASHTTSHQQLTTLDAAALQQELTSTFTQLDQVGGIKTTVMRPPYGDFNEKTWLNSGGLMSVSVLWNQDSEDWRRPGVDKIVSNALNGVTNGSIILMHDGGGPREQDLEALPKIIQQLQQDGYELVTVDELMASDPTIPQDVAKGDATMPKDCVWPTEIGD